MWWWDHLSFPFLSMTLLNPSEKRRTLMSSNTMQLMSPKSKDVLLFQGNSALGCRGKTWLSWTHFLHFLSLERIISLIYWRSRCRHSCCYRQRFFASWNKRRYNHHWEASWLLSMTPLFYRRLAWTTVLIKVTKSNPRQEMIMRVMNWIERAFSLFVVFRLYGMKFAIFIMSFLHFLPCWWRSWVMKWHQQRGADGFPQQQQTCTVYEQNSLRWQDKKSSLRQMLLREWEWEKKRTAESGNGRSDTRTGITPTKECNRKKEYIFCFGDSLCHILFIER
jgi:hypothetical protein